MKVIFVSGAYRANNIPDLQENICKARTEAIKLWQQGWAVICPHSNTAYFDDYCDEDVWLKGDIEILKRCDAIYMLKGWETSEGSKKEYNIAIEMGLEIIYQGDL